MELNYESLLEEPAYGVSNIVDNENCWIMIFIYKRENETLLLLI